MTPTETFSMASTATADAARDLFGDGSVEVKAVTEAGSAVGVK